MTPNRRILVTSGTWQAALNCVQSLGRLGHEVHLLDADPDPPLRRSRYCAAHVRCPSEYSSPFFAERLFEVVSTGRYDLLIPISDRAVDVVSHYRDKLGRHVHLALPGAKELALARDKAATTQFVAEHGVRIPESHFPATQRDAAELAYSLDYPAVVKLPRGTASCGVWTVHSAHELIGIYEKYGRPDNWPFVQRFVAGDIADVAAVADHGELAAYFSFYAEVRHLVGGTPPYVRTLADPALVEIAAGIVRDLNWHGPIDFDFIRDAAGAYHMLEINPRFSGSTNFAYKLGIDLPAAYLDVAFGATERSRQRPFGDGWMFRTVFPTEVAWWRGRPARRTGEVLRTTLRPRTRTNVYWRDWRLVAAQARHALRAPRMR